MPAPSDLHLTPDGVTRPAWIVTIDIALLAEGVVNAMAAIRCFADGSIVLNQRMRNHRSGTGVSIR